MTTITHTYGSVIAPGGDVTARAVTFRDSGEIVIGPGVADSDTITPASLSTSLTLAAGTATEPAVYELQHDSAATLPAGFVRRCYVGLDGAEGTSVALTDLRPHASPEAARFQGPSSGGSTAADKFLTAYADAPSGVTYPDSSNTWETFPLGPSDVTASDGITMAVGGVLTLAESGLYSFSSAITMQSVPSGDLKWILAITDDGTGDPLIFPARGVTGLAATDYWGASGAVELAVATDNLAVRFEGFFAFSGRPVRFAQCSVRRIRALPT